ncbi:MAG TPA: DNA repair protein RecN [Rhodospirillales bacterium]|nr:DNA repair protein RecN [Rhodospirillales bacterium]
MLRTLAISDVILIDRLDLTFHSGLCVLTGETGAGKSILLGALGLALGMRAEARMVRHGAGRAIVTAAFEPHESHDQAAVNRVLEQNGLGPCDDGLILRRVLSADGRSRAFINDVPVSVGLLKSVGEILVEIHGQFESQSLLNPATHRALLDAFGGLDDKKAAVAGAYQAWEKTRLTRTQAEDAAAKAGRDEDYLRHSLGELAAIDPHADEEEKLARDRTLMMHGEKLLAAMENARSELMKGGGVEGALQSALRLLTRAAVMAEGRLDEAIAAFDAAAAAAADGMAQLERAAQASGLDPAGLEAVEERLFALRALGRKHGVAVDGLAELKESIELQLTAIDGGEDALIRLKAEEAAARQAYVTAAATLTRAREKAALRLEKAVAAELPPLKLEKARIRPRLDAIGEEHWGADGREKIIFEATTNPGQPFGPLNRIASGGELARFMLALKAVLAEADPVPTLVFDEVDSGIGGAAAAAVGSRLARLAAGAQVLVITHSPQVAALGDHHWQVAKVASGGEADKVLTTVDILDAAARTEEIARMLAGARITDEARAAAASLLGGKANKDEPATAGLLVGDRS